MPVVVLRLTSVLSVRGLIGRDWDGGLDAPAGQVGAVRAGGVRLVAQHLVRSCAGSARGRRGTRIRCRTGIICGESPAWPAVSRNASTWRSCSQARWILVDQPPRDRPSAWSSGSSLMRSLLSWRAPAAWTWARAVVESTETSQPTLPAASAAAISACSRSSQMPSNCQHANNAYTRHHAPYRSGTSRQGSPPGPGTGRRRSARATATAADGRAGPNHRLSAITARGSTTVRRSGHDEMRRLWWARGLRREVVA